MIMPPIHGKLKAKDFFVYAACDDLYFDAFGKALVNSVVKNTTAQLHLHIFDPREDQLLLLEGYDQVSVSYEYLLPGVFNAAAEKWQKQPHRYKKSNSVALGKVSENQSVSTRLLESLASIVTKFQKPNNLEYLRYVATMKAIKRGDDKVICDRMKKTYYACARFIRLNDLVTNQVAFLAIDIDAVVRKNLSALSSNHDFYIHKIMGKNARFLAGGIYCNNTASGSSFFNNYSQLLLENISKDYLYWGLDQDILGELVPKYNWEQLPLSYVDWFMNSDSQIWTAKGQRKDLKIFKEEQEKYRL